MYLFVRILLISVDVQLLPSSTVSRSCDADQFTLRRLLYTWNPDKRFPMRNFKIKEDNTCDVCGAACEETLYEFRCYPRMTRANSSAVGRSCDADQITLRWFLFFHRMSLSQRYSTVCALSRGMPRCVSGEEILRIRLRLVES